jgi:predicted Fe-S protein YdhL (DUF1289 family)
MSEPQFGAHPVESPCIQVCRLDADGVCEGCHRTREEITLWTQLTEAQQRAVVARCRERAEATSEQGDQRAPMA